MLLLSFISFYLFISMYLCIHTYKIHKHVMKESLLLLLLLFWRNHSRLRQLRKRKLSFYFYLHLLLWCSSFLYKDLSSWPILFSFSLKLFFKNIFCNAYLLSTNIFSFCSFEKVFTPLLKDNFARYRTLSWWTFLPSQYFTSLYSFLTCMVSEKSEVVFFFYLCSS
jgi:hypothetical protein